VLPQVQEWLYTDGEDATAAEFQERLDMLKDAGGHIFFRYVMSYKFIIGCS
jgi:hypoxia up-regulated 1